MSAGTAYRRYEIILIEAICIETVRALDSHSRINLNKNKFTEGETYVASLNSRGNYIVDTDGGREQIFTPQDFARHFKEVCT